MVQLKFYVEVVNYFKGLCFNSCMVQLKSIENKDTVLCAFRFNSCMVQLKYTFNDFIPKCRVVLIPVWCN